MKSVGGGRDLERLERIIRYFLNILIPALGWVLLCVLGPKLRYVLLSV